MLFIKESDFANQLINNDVLKSKKELSEWLLMNKIFKTGDAISFTIYFGGLDQSNNFKLYSLDSTSFILEEVQYNNSLGFYLAPSKYWENSSYITNQFNELYKSYNGTANSMFSILQQLNNIVASKDPSVNSQVTYFFREKEY